MEYRDSSEDFAVLQKKLICAVKDSNAEKVTEICISLPRNFNINNVFERPFYGSRYETPLLHLACSARNPGEILEILVEYGANLWSTKLRGLNLFQYACERKILEAIQFILGKCQNEFFLQSLSDSGYDALFYATESCKSDPEEGKKVVEHLLSKGIFNINRFRKDGKTEVLSAVVAGRYQLASMLCKLGADVNLGYHSSKKAIQWASEQSGYHDMIQLLIDHCANKNEVWRHCQRPIHLALKHGLTRNADVLLRSGVDISSSIRLNNPKYLWISTFCLAARRCPSLIPEFLARGANPQEIHSTSGYSVIGFAIENDASREVIKSLIRAGANIAHGCHGKSAIKCCKTLAQMLAFVDCGISLKTIESELDNNLLRMVLLEDNSSEGTVVENVKLLLSKGASFDDPRNGGISFLNHTLRRRKYKVAECLIERGINLNHKDEDGNTALHVICKNKLYLQDTTLVQKLIAAGSSVNEVNNSEETPLLVALRENPWYSKQVNIDLIKCLLDNGADVHVRFPKDKKSTLLYAMESQDIEIKKLLLNAGYDVNKREADGELPIFHCFPLDTSKKRELFTVILEAGTVSNSVDSKGTSLLERVFQILVTVPAHVGNVTLPNDKSSKAKVKIKIEIKPLFNLLLNKNADSNTAQEGEDSLLMKAIRYEAEEIVNLLIEAGSSIIHIGENKSAPLDVCCRLSIKKVSTGSKEKCYRMKNEGFRILNILLNKDLPLDIPNSNGKYPLELVMGFDNTETEIQYMLSKGADPNKYDKNEECPLIKSIYGSPSVTLALLKAGADSQTTAKDGRSVYDLFTERAFYDDSLSCLNEGFAAEIQMRALTRNQVSLLKIEDISSTPTVGQSIRSFLKQLQKRPATKVSGKSMYVKFGDSLSCWKTVRWLEKLVEKGVVRNLKAKDDQLYWLNIKQKLNNRRCLNKEKGIQKQHSTTCCEIIKTLIEAGGIDVNRKTSNGLLPLCVAVRLGSLSLINFLLEKKANPNILDNMDETPLSLALIHGDMDIVRVLVEAKSNVNHTGVLPGNSAEQKESVLSRLLDEKGSFASLDKRKLLVEFLIQHGANINLDKEGVDSPLIKAVKLATPQKTGHQDVDCSLSPLNLVAELLNLGAEINHRGESLSTALHVCCQQQQVYNTSLDLRKQCRGLCTVSTVVEFEEDYLYFDEESIDMDDLVPVYSDEDKSENENVDEEIDFSDTIFNLLLNSEASVNAQAKCGATPVHIAIRRKCRPHVLEMLNRGFEANTKDALGVTCLMLAADWGEEMIIKELIKCGADINLEDQSGSTALHYLCLVGRNMELLGTFVESGSDINAVNKDGYSPLNVFVKEGQQLESKNLIYLISKGADPNCCPEGCESPLTNALKRKKYEIAKVLLKSGALVNHVSDSGITPLSMAVSKDKGLFRKPVSILTEGKTYETEREEIVDYILEAGANTNILTANTTSPLCTLLSCPLRRDTMAILSNLLKHKADPNIGTENPLCLASKVHLDAVELLLKAGTNVNRKGLNENTPLVECLQSGKVDDKAEILKALIEAGADTNIASNSGKYPVEIVLQESIVQGSKPRRWLWESMCFEKQPKLHLEKLVSLLLNAGAKCNQCKSGTDSALHIAVGIGETNVVKLLITNGADVNHIGENQETPLHRYFKKGIQDKKEDTFEKGTKRIFRPEPILNNREETVLDILLSCKANPNTKDEDGNTPLSLSLRTNAEDFRKLLAAGADPFYEGENIFKTCVLLDNLSFLKVLLQEKGTSFICDNLFSSFWERQNDVTLLENRLCTAAVTLQMLSSPNELNVDRKNYSGNTPLIYFCEQNEDMVVEKLLERGADVNMVDNDGRAALHAIFQSKDKVRYRILSLLMKRGPDVKIKDASGKTVFQKAEEEYQEQHFYKRTDHKWLSVLMKEMLLAGEICEKLHLNSLLVLASQREHFGFMTVLAEKGADLSVKKGGRGILHLCLSNRYHYEERQLVSLEECLDFIRTYKKHGGRLDEVDSNGNTPLMTFLKNETDGYYTRDRLMELRNEIVTLLAYDKSTVTKRDNSGLSTIHIVSSKRWLSTMKLLVSKGGDLCEKDAKQNTCLHLCLKEDPDEFLHDMVVYLVEKGILLNQVNIVGESPLFLLVEKTGSSYEFNEVTTIEFLLKRGALSNLNLKRNNTLVAAIRSANVKVISLLLDYHAEVNEIEDGPTALHIFFRCLPKYDRKQKDDIAYVVHRILEKGANVNAKDKDGKTALHLAIKALCVVDQKCNTENIIQQFLDFGADINALDNRGQTPLSIVFENRSVGSVGQPSIGCCLLSKGADPNIDFALNQCMRNITFYGLSAEWKAFIQSLIQKGADPNLCRDGKHPILLATKLGDPDIVKLFLEKGANVHSRDQDENTCLHLACDLKTESARNTIASLVLEHGCSVNKSNKSGTTPLANLIKRMTDDADFMDIVQTETTTVTKVDLSLFNKLVCGGAKLDSATTLVAYSRYDTGSILATLVRNGFFGAAATLIKCGYDFRRYEDFERMDFSHFEFRTISVKGKRYKRIGSDREKNEFLNIVKKHKESQESSLSTLCRNTIRTHLINVGQGAEIESKIMSLPLPRRIKMYLTLREHTQDFEQMQIQEKESFYMRTFMDDYSNMYYHGMDGSDIAHYGIGDFEIYGGDDSDVDEYIHYYRDNSDSDDYYY